MNEKVSLSNNNSKVKKYTRKTIFLVSTLLISGFLAFSLQPFFNDKTIDVLVNIYSILAGFLIGIIALIGDPASLSTGSWRIAEASSNNVVRGLQGTKNLLSLYLLTLFLVFLYTLGSIDILLQVLVDKKIEIDDLPVTLYRVKDMFELLILFFALMAFIYSFKLPSKLFEIQQIRMSKEIESRREAANIKSNIEK